MSTIEKITPELLESLKNATPFLRLLNTPVSLLLRDGGTKLFEREVKEKASLLDKVVPSWAHRVPVHNLDRRNMRMGGVLFLLFGPYWNGAKVLGISCSASDMEGFFLDDDSDRYSSVPYPTQLVELRSRWIEEIQLRLDCN